MYMKIFFSKLFTDMNLEKHIWVHCQNFFSSDYPSVNWKRAQPAPLSINNKNSAGYRQPLGSNTQAHGRTDWAAKYVHLTT